MSIEFEARVSNGTIEIPEEYRDRLKGQVRVLVFQEDTGPDNLIKELIETPLNVPDFVPLTREEIYSRD